MFLKKGAEADKRTLEGQKEEMIRQAKKYKVGNTVLGKGGAQLQIKDISSINGLITLKDMNNRTIYRFANGLGEVLERGGSQVDLGPDLKGESFEYIVKKYR